MVSMFFIEMRMIFSNDTKFSIKVMLTYITVCKVKVNIILYNETSNWHWWLHFNLSLNKQLEDRWCYIVLKSAEYIYP